MSAFQKSWLSLAGLALVGVAAFQATGAHARQESRFEVNPQPLPPEFFSGLVGVASGQRARLSVASILPKPAPGGPPENPGVVILELFSELGDLLQKRIDQISEGGSTSVDLSFEDLTSLLPPGTTQKRIEIRVAALQSVNPTTPPPVILHPPNPCRVSLEIYDADSAKTTIYLEGSVAIR